MADTLEGIAKDISYIQRDVKDIKDTLKADYITRDEFEPIKRVVYGMVATILFAFIGAVIALVIRK